MRLSNDFIKAIEETVKRLSENNGMAIEKTQIIFTALLANDNVLREDIDNSMRFYLQYNKDEEETKDK